MRFAFVRVGPARISPEFSASGSVQRTSQSERHHLRPSFEPTRSFRSKRWPARRTNMTSSSRIRAKRTHALRAIRLTAGAQPTMWPHGCHLGADGVAFRSQQRSAKPEMNGDNFVFEGLKVIDVASWTAGPVAATILADYGADVIKVEMPGVGDGYRALAALPGMPQSPINYTWMMDARNKRSLTLNLKDPRGREILSKLVAACDVYVTNQPMAMRRKLGLTYADLRPLNPRMIYASLTAYGEQGPERDREGFDLVAYWARTGLMDLVRNGDNEPAQSLPGMGDHPTAVALYAAIVTALLQRERTGRGSEVHTSLIANGLWAASCLAQARLVDADFSMWRSPNRIGITRPVYRAADSRWLQFTMVRTPTEIVALFSVLGMSDLLANPRFATPEARLDNGVELVARMRQ